MDSGLGEDIEKPCVQEALYQQGLGSLVGACNGVGHRAMHTKPRGKMMHLDMVYRTAVSWRGTSVSPCPRGLHIIECPFAAPYPWPLLACWFHPPPPPHLSSINKDFHGADGPLSSRSLATKRLETWAATDGWFTLPLLATLRSLGAQAMEGRGAPQEEAFSSVIGGSLRPRRFTLDSSELPL